MGWKHNSQMALIGYYSFNRGVRINAASITNIRFVFLIKVAYPIIQFARK